MLVRRKAAASSSFLRRAGVFAGLALVALSLTVTPACAGKLFGVNAPHNANRYQEDPQPATQATAAIPAEAPVQKAAPTPQEPVAQVQAAQQPMQQASGGSGLDYRLGAGDRLRVTVFGEPDLSGDFEVDSTGRLSMPLIGQVQATNTTISQVSKAIESLLSQGYLRDPKVSIDVLNYRPFFILGEVMKPGSYPYVNGLTVVNAVALAGGYTYRADKGDITIVRAGDTSKTEYKIDEVGEVMPGDVVRVPERFF